MTVTARPGEVEALRLALAITAGALRASVLLPPSFADADADLRWVHPAVLPIAPLLPRLSVRLLDRGSHRDDRWQGDARLLVEEMKGWRQLAVALGQHYC